MRPGWYAFVYLPPSTQTDHGVQIRLTNSGVPVSLIDSDAEEIAPIDLTVQIPLRFVEPLNTVGIIKTEGESDEPLFRLTITRFTKLNSTSIGTRGSHALCASPLDLQFLLSC